MSKFSNIRIFEVSNFRSYKILVFRFIEFLDFQIEMESSFVNLQGLEFIKREEWIYSELILIQYFNFFYELIESISSITFSLVWSSKGKISLGTSRRIIEQQSPGRKLLILEND